MRTKLYRIFFLVIFAAVTGAAQTSDSTYQGKLSDNGDPASATYEVQFHLCPSGICYKTTVTPDRSGFQLSGSLRPAALGESVLDLGYAIEELQKLVATKLAEQRSEIDEQKKRNADLQKDVDALRSSLEALKAEIDDLRTLIICRTTMRPELCKVDE